MKKFLILIILGIFIIPLSAVIRFGGNYLWYKQYLGLLFFFFLGMSFFIWDFNKCLSVFLGICLFSTYFVAMANPRPMLLLWHLNLGCLASYGISRFNRNYRKYILYALLGLVILQFLWLIMQSWNLDPIFSSLKDKKLDDMVALSASKDQLGSFFALTFPLMLYIYPPLGALSLAGIFISKSSFAFASAVVSGLLYFFFINRRIFKIALIVTLLIGSLFFLKVEELYQADFNTRLSVWKYAIKAVWDKKVEIFKMGRRMEINTNSFVGYGFGNFLRIFPFIPEKENFNYVNEKFTHAHNDYVELFFELGYVGLFSLIALAGNFFWRFKHLIKKKEAVLYFSSIVAFLLNACGNFLTQMAIPGMLLIIFYGLFESARRETYGKASVLV